MIVRLPRVMTHHSIELSNLDPRNEAFEVISCILNVPKCGRRVDTWVTNDNLEIN